MKTHLHTSPKVVKKGHICEDSFAYLSYSSKDYNVVSVQVLETDAFKFCCIARHVATCSPQPDEFSSCEDLMANRLLQVRSLQADRCDRIHVMFFFLICRSIQMFLRNCCPPSLRHSACCCHRSKRICDVFLPSLSWIPSASFPGYTSFHYCLL